MENRKPLVIGIILGLIILSPNKVGAYGVETHAYLTDQIIDFYNQNYSNSPIKNELKSYIVDGSRREDDAPRWMNHFYDPVNNKGLSDPEWGNGFSSKEWAQSDSKQTTYAYKPISYMASILTASEQGNVNGMDLNFTWNQAIRYYREGEIEKAMLTLGHVLHLVEDVSVPDHTRNDAHPHPLGDGSPYEQYTEKFTDSGPDKELTSRLLGKKPFDSMPTLSSYFDEMANYSNNNFYSEDTIDKVYNSPKPVRFENVGEVTFAIGKDDNGTEYKLFSKPIESNRLPGIATTPTLADDTVINDYWSHLSVKSVQVGAGVIKLFFNDVERVNYGDSRLVKDDRNPITWVIDNARAYAQVISSFGRTTTSALNNISNEKLVETIDVKSLQKNENDLRKSDNTKSISNPVVPKQENSPQIKKTIDEEKETEQEAQLLKKQEQQVEKEIQQEQASLETKQTLSFKECSFSTAKLPSREKVIINEVAWMGGSSDFGLTSTDEWIELKNISGVELDVNGWQLIDKAEQIKINFSSLKRAKLNIGEFVLLERTDDDSAPNIPADLIYSNTLNNSDEGLRLFDGQCNFIDEVLANPDWLAGDNVQKRTMERSSDLSWHTYNGTVQNSILGTPKKENSVPVVVRSSSGGASVSVDSQQPITNNQQQSSAPKILISEVQITGGTGKTENDFIELYNPNSTQVNLSGYRLVKRTKTGITDTSIKSWTTDVYIPANGYYLWANSGYADISVPPDVTTTSTISNDNGVAIRFGSEDTGTLIDSVAWGGAENAFIEGSVFPVNLGVDKSFQRKFQNNNFVDTNDNASDFEIQTCPSPKTQSRDCQTADQTPRVSLPLSIIEVVYNPEGSDEGKELVRVNNPNNEEINVGNYSLQYLGSDGDFTKIKKKNFETGNKIPAQGIFKIGMNCRTATPCANVDLSWSEALNNSAGTVFLVFNQESLSGLSDSDIVRGFHYPEATILVEPSNFTATYDSNKLEISLSWDGNPSLVYQVQEYNSPGVTIFEGKGSSFSKRIDEVGKNYKFSIKAFNENAEHTELVEKEVNAPTFIKDIHFYNSTHYTDQGDAQDNLIEFSYDSYPFLPLDLVYAPGSNPGTGPNYKTLVFYFNAEAPKRIHLNGATPLVEDTNNALGVKYETCAGGNSLQASLVLPDIIENCNVGGGFGNSSFNYHKYLSEGDKHLLLATSGFTGQSTFTESDYMTLAFYGFQRDFPQGSAPVNGIHENFKLLATDKTKYYFENLVTHQRPELTGEITLGFDQQNSKLNVSWPSATDPDTLDSLLTYEIKYASSADWQPVGGNSVIKIVSAGDSFSISVRAKDDFGNYSTPVLTAEWSYPATDFSFTQGENNAWSSSFGQRDGSSMTGISLQSVTPVNNFQFSKVSLRTKQLPPANDTANLKLSVYPDSNNEPDFSSVVASSIISNLYNPDSNSDITFNFTTPVSLSANNKYWLALEVESYADVRGFFRNIWQNAVSSVNPYLLGEAARIRVNVTDGVYSYGDFALEPDNDWYIKIGSDSL